MKELTRLEEFGRSLDRNAAANDPAGYLGVMIQQICRDFERAGENLRGEANELKRLGSNTIIRLDHDASDAVHVGHAGASFDTQWRIYMILRQQYQMVRAMAIKLGFETEEVS